MPNNSDTRAGYLTIDFNMSWFWEMLRDRCEDIKFNGCENDDNCEHYISKFADYIETKAQEYIIHKVFSTECYKECAIYDDIWIYLYESASEWVNENSKWAEWVSESDED